MLCTLNSVINLCYVCLKERFVEHEIDLELFKTLTENDLRDLGIHAFGVRRRMLLTIAGKKSFFLKINLDWFKFIVFYC